MLEFENCTRPAGPLMFFATTYSLHVIPKISVLTTSKSKAFNGFIFNEREKKGNQAKQGEENRRPGCKKIPKHH